MKYKSNKFKIILFILLILFTLYLLWNNKFTEGYTNNKMYNISLCCIIKDEKYLEEFIIYYKVIGVDHFYIYDNDSKPSIKERLNKPYFNDCCTIIDFPGKVKQPEAYTHCLENYGKETTWLIFVDGDEYILPKKHNNLIDFLNEYNDAYGLGINWVLFGSSYHDKKQDGFLIDKYRFCNKEQNKHIKSILKPEYVDKYIDPHYFQVKNPNKYLDCKRNKITSAFNTNPTTDIIQINHYHGKSVEEQLEKQLRGTPDRMVTDFKPHFHDINNDIKDDTIANKYLEQVSNIYNKIYNL